MNSKTIKHKKSSSASNTITRSVDSQSWRQGTITRPYDNAIKSTHFAHHEAGVSQFIN